jgi:hypothetical protein
MKWYQMLWNTLPFISVSVYTGWGIDYAQARNRDL